MNIAKSTTETMLITGAERLDPITVFTEDYEPGKGRITIVCWGQVWAATGYWGAMSGETIKQFFRASHPDYLLSTLAWNKKLKKSETAYFLRIIEAVQAAFWLEAAA